MTTLKELRAKNSTTTTTTTAATTTATTNTCVSPIKYINVLDPTQPQVKLYLNTNGTTVKRICKDIVEARQVFKNTVQSYTNMDQYTCQAGYLIIFADVVFKPQKKQEPAPVKEEPTIMYDLLGKEVK